MGRGSAVIASPWLDPHHQSPIHTRGKRSFPCLPETKREAYEGDPPKGTKSSNKGHSEWGAKPPLTPELIASPPCPLSPVSVRHLRRAPGGGSPHRKSPEPGLPSLLQSATWPWATHQLIPDSQARGGQGQRWRIN